MKFGLETPTLKARFLTVNKQNQKMNLIIEIGGTRWYKE
jgi:hypothetical protein